MQISDDDPPENTEGQHDAMNGDDLQNTHDPFEDGEWTTAGSA